MKKIFGFLEKRYVIYPVLVLLGVLFVLGRSGLFDPKDPVASSAKGTQEIGERALRVFTGDQHEFGVTPETPGYENYLKLDQGCPVKDCIPAIDEPVFESAAEARQWLQPEDVVFALEFGGEARAYPQRIMNWHEIVNDEVGGEQVAVTFCPLCGSAIAFDRQVGDRVLDFGVSGKLHNSDLVMYDRQTETLWQQISGEGIVGELFGTSLEPVSMNTVRWGDWVAEHPETKVLSRETGFSRDYDSYPYGSYESDRRVIFGVEGGVDETIHPKTEVYGVGLGGETKAYTREALERDGTIADSLGGQAFTLEYDGGKVVGVTSTGGEVVPLRMFWFAWKAFAPGTGLYR